MINTPQRLQSADVYRGFVMLLMMGEVLHFEAVATALPQSKFWQFMAFHQSHVPWVGCSLHDMIQPSFSFLVGVVLPYSILHRQNNGATNTKMLIHAAKRSLILIGLGIFLRSMHRSITYFTFEDTLTQIGLGYTFLFVLGFVNLRIQVLVVIGLLVGYWLAFALWPLPGQNFDFAAVGANPKGSDWLHGFAAHWNLNTNMAHAFDQWLLNQFPREAPYTGLHGGGYVTLSFIPTLATMILGLLAGQILLQTKDTTQKLKLFVMLGISLIVGGLVLHFMGICPIVKRIWTPSWVLFSGGVCFLFLALFYYVIDLKRYTSWSYFLLVIGTNSIAAYIIAHTIDSFISKNLMIHLGNNFPNIFGLPYASLVHGGLILIIEWLVLYWMYQRKIFIKI